MRTCRFFIVSSCLFIIGLWSGHSAEPHDDPLVTAKMLLSEGVDQWDEQIMLNARMLFEECLPKSGEMQWLVHYYIGYADFRLTAYYRAQDKADLRLTHLEDGIEHLYSSLDLNEDFAESHALLALMVGQIARLDPSQMASRGMESQQTISEARRLGGENPRVAMISGVMYFFTPEQFGGSKAKAFEEIKRSVSLFKTTKSDDERFPDWGYSDALTWLGRLQMEAKEFELARQSLEEALKVNPENRSARRVKLQLEERMRRP